MRFIFFTDIHLLENTDSIIGFEKCLDRMIAFEPALLINGGDLGVTPEAVKIYYRMIDSLPIPVYHVNGNHEICNGHLDGERSGQFSYSFDFGGVHFVILETVRFFNPTTEHPQNWYFIVDQQDLEWLNSDLNLISKETPIILASHCSISTSAPNRFGQKIGMKFPINEVMNADQVVELLKPFDNVATLHGHDHENCRHRLGNIQILTTAAVSGSWWKNGLQSANVSGEPQGFRLIDITSDQIVSQYITILESQSQLADWYMQEEQDRYFINVFDDLEQPYAGCLYASCFNEPEQFPDQAKKIVSDAILEWRKQLGDLIEAVLNDTGAKLIVDKNALADNFTVVMEGGFILSKALGDAKLTANQLKQYRNYLQLLFAH